MNSPALERDISGCQTSHRRLLEAVRGLTDADVRSASLLPDWTVGHVLTHLARNADGVVRLFEAAERDDVGLMYDSAEARDAEIEVGAARASMAFDSLAESIERLEAAWAAASPDGWKGRGKTLNGDVLLADLPRRRWFECEVHCVDLGLGYTFAELPSELVGLELRRATARWASRQPMGLTTLPEPLLALEPHERLAWMLGRRHVEGVLPAEPY